MGFISRNRTCGNRPLPGTAATGDRKIRGESSQPSPALDGLVIVALSDMHLGSQLGKRWLDDRIAQVLAQQPDLVVLLGDIFEGHGPPEAHWSQNSSNSPHLSAFGSSPAITISSGMTTCIFIKKQALTCYVILGPR